MANQFLYEELETIYNNGYLRRETPAIIRDNLSSFVKLRPYQEQAFQYFVEYFENEKLNKRNCIHNLFHMATGSGKTVMMAGLILYLYSQGYRNFLFFVNKDPIIAKTRENFLNPLSDKYLFQKELSYAGERIRIQEVKSFQGLSSEHCINICFKTIQGLNNDIETPKESKLGLEDFKDLNNPIVLISDESHHINAQTKKMTNEELSKYNSWEYSVIKAFEAQGRNILLEFTATAELSNKNVLAKYQDKIIYNYTLREFRASGYTKDFQNFTSNSKLWDRTLMALILSEYRRYLFGETKQDIKPVIMLKSKIVKESQEFYKLFFRKIKELTPQDIEHLSNSYQDEGSLLSTALSYFLEQDKSNSFNLLVNSIKDAFTEEQSIIMNGKSDDNEKNRILVNSLESKDNPIRIIFAVDMLDEGWDVLNLFDIVRLYDTRQGGKGISKATISEAQLIGRGARYCPFQITEEQERGRRKYDNDLGNKYRILETMLYHSLDDSKYISELRQALIATGMQDEQTIKVRYVVKDEFKESELYQRGVVFANKRIPKNRQAVSSIDERQKYISSDYYIRDSSSSVVNLFGEEELEQKDWQLLKEYKFKELEYHILRGASENFPFLKFSYLKKKFPQLESLREFLTSDNYCGNNKICLRAKSERQIRGIDLYEASVKACGEIERYISTLKQEYEGSKEFYAMSISKVIKDKVLNLSTTAEEGHGSSQKDIDLKSKKWYVYNDNFGTDQEKAFIKYFSEKVAPELEKRGLEFYVIRNERLSELAIYSFDTGERFEPDYLLLLERYKGKDLDMAQQIYIEPKGKNLIEKDKWKEDFLAQIKQKSIISDKLFSSEYSLLGLPFFNNDSLIIHKFDECMQCLLKELDK